MMVACMVRQSACLPALAAEPVVDRARLRLVGASLRARQVNRWRVCQPYCCCRQRCQQCQQCQQQAATSTSTLLERAPLLLLVRGASLALSSKRRQPYEPCSREMQRLTVMSWSVWVLASTRLSQYRLTGAIHPAAAKAESFGVGSAAKQSRPLFPVASRSLAGDQRHWPVALPSLPLFRSRLDSWLRCASYGSRDHGPIVPSSTLM
jgi:hypothetical protein